MPSPQSVPVWLAHATSTGAVPTRAGAGGRMSVGARGARSRGLARGLGGLSLALAVGPMIVPARVASLVGLRPSAWQRLMVAAVGGRELATGVGLLSQPKRWMLVARCLGDAMDLALLGAGVVGGTRRCRSGPGARSRLGARPRPGTTYRATKSTRRTATALAAVSAVAVVDVAAAARWRPGEPVVEAHSSVTIAKDRDAVFRYWRDFAHMPDIMEHLDEVEITGQETSRWVATAPLGRKVAWEARIVDEVPGERITWQSVDGRSGPGKGPSVSNEGVVHFLDAPGGRGTEVHVTLRYDVRGGSLGKGLARYFGREPRQVLDDDLRRLKQFLETGEVLRSDGAPRGKRARHEFPQRPARPLAPSELAEEVAR